MLVVESQESFDINLCAERRSHSSRHSSVSNSRSASNIDLAESFERRSKKSATLGRHNETLCVVISCLYHMCESIRRTELIEHVHNKAPSRWPVEKLSALRASFIQELDEPLEGGKPSLVILLLDMMPAFVRGNCPRYPIKKVLLLSWKVLLTTLGDNKHLREEKARKRREADASRLGRKVRSVHPSRPFNRQFACASNWASDGAGGGGAVSSSSPSASGTSEDGGPNGDGQPDEGVGDTKTRLVTLEEALAYKERRLEEKRRLAEKERFKPTENEGWSEDDEVDEVGESNWPAADSRSNDQKRRITYEIIKNRGIVTKSRRKDATHSRVKKRRQFSKALIRRRSQVPDVRLELNKYDGEKRGIRCATIRSVKLS